MRHAVEVGAITVVKGLLRSDSRKTASVAPTPAAVLNLSLTHFGGC
jgi:hypothetical protein